MKRTILNYIIIACVSFLPTICFGLNKYECIENFTTFFDYKSDNQGNLEVAQNGEKPKQPVKVIFTILGTDGAYMKGNVANVYLSQIYHNQYLEKTPRGNIILYTFFNNLPNKNYSIMVAHKAYSFLNALMTLTSVYECRDLK